MFVDAAALVAVLGREVEGERCLLAISRTGEAFTSPIAVWEAAMALARRDKLGVTTEEGFEIVGHFLQDNAIELRDLPPPAEAVQLSASAAGRYRTRTGHLNIADCFHYACARHYSVPILSTADEFRFTDLQVVD